MSLSLLKLHFLFFSTANAVFFHMGNWWCSEITLCCTVISYLQYARMKAGVRRTGQRCKVSGAWMECFACLHEPLIISAQVSSQISPWGWLNTIAFPSFKSQVCVAKHTTRQCKLAVWMMVITLTTEAANASFQEGAVWWASLMSVQGQEFIYLLMWLNYSAGKTS